MSIRSHLIALVLFCAIGGLLLGVFLIDRQHAFGRDNAVLIELRTQVHDSQRLEDQTKQLLISVDLLFGYGETYLLSASRSGAASAINLTQTLYQNTTANEREAIRAALGALTQLQDEINHAEKAAIRPNFSITEQQLNRVDKLTRELVEAVTQLKAGATTNLETATRDYEEKSNQFDLLAWGAIGAYLLSVLSCLWLSSRAVSAPLAALSASASRALSNDGEFAALPAGPTEVQHLTASIGEFVESLEHQNARSNALLEAIPDALLLIHKNAGVVYVKPGINVEVSPLEEFVASSEYEVFLNTDQGAIAQQLVKDCMDTSMPTTAELKIPDGDSTKILEARACAINNNEAVLVLRDLTQKREAEARIRHMAYHDSLTGLLNRRAFKEVIAKQIESSAQQPFGLFFVDADRFKVINDTHGHDVGDEVLRHITSCIQDSLRDSDTVSRGSTEERKFSARMGGDEFVVLLPGVDSPAIALSAAQRLQAAIATPLIHDNVKISASVTIGAALYPQHGTTVDELMQNADLAMYEAKRSDVIQYCPYDEQLAAKNSLRRDIESKLSSAIAKQDLFLMYQPKIDLRSRKVIGAEALVRWKDGDNFIPPNEFIPIAEETGLIIPLGEFISANAIAQMATWREKGIHLNNMAINVSAAQLAHPQFYESILKLAADAGVPSAVLNIEITETLMLNHYERATKVLEQLKEGGFTIALDDFGTGYSSLSYIKDLPLNVLKIDQSFVAGIEHSETERSIIATIIQLGKTLGLSIVAEGVETQQQADFLEKSGCDQAQGYYFSRPVAPEVIEQLMLEQREPALVDQQTTVAAQM